MHMVLYFVLAGNQIRVFLAGGPKRFFGWVNQWFYLNNNLSASKIDVHIHRACLWLPAWFWSCLKKQGQTKEREGMLYQFKVNIYFSNCKFTLFFFPSQKILIQTTAFRCQPDTYCDVLNVSRRTVSECGRKVYVEEYKREPDLNLE